MSQALRPTSILGTHANPTPSGISKVVFPASPTISGIQVKAKPEVRPKLPSLVQQNENNETVTIYADKANRHQLVTFTKRGIYHGGPTLAANIPYQPTEVDGSSKKVHAFEGNIVLHGSSAVTSAKQQLTFDNSTNRIVPVVSSKRYKSNIKTLTEEDVDLSRLFDTLEVKTYTDKRKDDKGEKEYGFIAEELKDFPDLLIHDSEGQIESVNYSLISLLAVEQVKRLTKRVEELERALLQKA